MSFLAGRSSKPAQCFLAWTSASFSSATTSSGRTKILTIVELRPIDLHVLLGCSRCFERSHFFKTSHKSTACRYAEAALQWAMASGGGLNDYLSRNSACVLTRCGCEFLCFNISVSFRFAEIVRPRVNVWAFARHGGGRWRVCSGGGLPRASEFSLF